MNKFQKYTLGASKGIIWTLFAIITFYLFVISIFGTCVMCYTDDHIYYIKDFAGVLLAGLFFLVAVLELFYRKILWNEKKIKKILIVITIVWIGLMSVLILAMQLSTTYDQTFVYQAAGELIRGDYTKWQVDGYLYIHPYQNGLVLLEVPFVAMFGDKAYLVIQHVNIFIWISTMYAVYLIAKRFWGKKTAYLTYFLLLAFVPMWSYVTFVYGTIPGLACSVWSIYMALRFMDKKKFGWAIGSGVLMAVAVMCKTNYEVFAIALILLLLLHAIRNKSFKDIVAAAIIIVCVMIEIKSVPLILHLITGESTTSGIPFTAWLAMGLKDSSIAPGWYNRTEDLIYQDCNHDVAAMQQEALASIQASIALFQQLPSYAVSFFGRKTASLWNSPVFECFTIITKRYVDNTRQMPYWLRVCLFNGGIVNDLLTVYMDVLESVIYFGVVMYWLFARKKHTEENSIFALIFLGGFIFHVFWEGKNQYTIPYYCMLFPYAARGFAEVVKAWHAICKEASESGRKGQHIKILFRKIKTTVTGHILAIMALLILLVALIPAKYLITTLKIRGDESEYLYFLENETEWKNADYYYW